MNFIQKNPTKLVVDMVYDDFVFSNHVNFNPLLLTRDWRKVFTVNSVSKNWGLPGLRIGWIATHADNVLKLVKQLAHECVCVSPVTQEIAANAIEAGNQMLINTVLDGKETVESLLNLNDKIKINYPDGGTQFYAKFPVNDVDDFADYMLINYKLVLATASNYVMADSKSIRIPIGYTREKITTCVDLLVSGLNAYLKENCNSPGCG